LVDGRNLEETILEFRKIRILEKEFNRGEKMRREMN